ncbi:phosphopantothenoylcysteine decarboxylase [Bacillus sp. MUM 13]|uniref:phosphopantothenoylcysteine decarboxylase domain-containing protein n=1 Tax=Bacillus sp. MUM 13 TaxID=1678001 RepID=UPI0008F5B998|nr:phosphopantothenoylcysteine decarboxylase [Bacillus sp. MUM 13]OIK04302.1 hypothetical protein BIV59_22245 [Bacillus sp. MUM 13]
MLVKNVLISSGGCIEKWDNVRGHTNLAKGNIGKMIAEEFLALGANVTYLHGYFTALPSNLEQQNLHLEPFEGIFELQDKMKHLILEKQIDVVIMAAAGSDWVVDKMVNQEGQILSKKGKITSDNPPIIHLKRAPKVLNQIKKWKPDVMLVGFKLESNLNKTELIERAVTRMNTSSADFMVANYSDSLSTTGATHYIINKDQDICECISKEETAKSIAIMIEKQFPLSENVINIY